MNGLVVRDEDLHRFAIHVKDNLARKPVDLLWQEYALGNTEHTAILIRGRVLKTYAYNLFAHIGAVSSFSDRPPRKEWPACYAHMSHAWSLQENEAFREECTIAGADFSPCQAAAGPGAGAAKAKSDASQRWVRSKLGQTHVAA